VTSPVNSGSYAEEVQSINSSAAGVPGEDSNFFQNTTTAGGDPISTTGGPYTLSYYLEGTLGVSGVLFVQAQWANAAGPQGGGAGFTFNGSPGATLPSSYTLETLNLGTPPSSSDTGVFLEFSAETGAVSGGTSTAFIDDVSITGSVVPEPTMLSIPGLSSLMMRRRRRL
jgi:hypothetical protein